MILLDYSGVAWASAMAACPLNKPFNIDLIRHSILNSMRAGIKKCKIYGEVIICCDGPNNWRKVAFANYKANRSKNDDIKLYWDSINRIKNEIKEHFPYKMIEVNTAEADDVIAVLAQEIFEESIIVSNDKDMVQLMAIGTKVYSPGKDAFIVPTREYTQNKQKIVEEITPQQFLTMHILKGDRSDGVPNVRSPDDIFIVGGTQKDISRQFIENFTMDQLNEEELKNWNRNEQLISLFKIPEELKKNIIETYNNTETPNTNKIFDYMVNKRLNDLIEKINDF